MADIFDEVDDDLKKDRYERLWRDYGKYAIGAAIAVIAATAGWTGWNDHRQRQIGAEGERLMIATARGVSDPNEAIKELGVLGRDGNSGYAQLAGFYGAALKARQGDHVGAAAEFRVMSRSLKEPELRDVAELYGALAGAEKLTASEADALVAKFGAANSLWRFAAWEIAAIAALAGDDQARARGFYTRLADDLDAPPGQRARASELLQTLAP
jgi:hypothetical protein